MSDEGRWDIPRSWTWAKANEFARVVGGGTPAKAKEPYNYSEDGVPWITPADLSGYRGTHISRGARSLSKKGFESCSARMLPKGSVLLSSRAPVGYCVVATNDICTNQGFKSFVLHKEDIDSEYLRYYLIGSKRYLENESSGTTFLELSGGRAEQLLFPIAPASEQQRIVSKVDELFSRIDEGERALQRVSTLVERYRQSVLKAAVTGELTRDWRAARKAAGEPVESGEALLARILTARREAWEQAELAKLQAKGITPKDDAWKKKYTEPAPLDTSDLPDLPSGWVWASMTQLAWQSSYGTSQKCSYGAVGDAVLRIPNVRSGSFAYDDVKNATTGLGLEPGDELAVGDLLVIRTNGSESLIGTGAVLLKDAPFSCYFASYLIRFRLALPEWLAEWINFCWQSDVVRRFVHANKATSAGQYNISQSSLMKMHLPIPPSDERQIAIDEVANALSQIEGVLATASSQTTLREALRQSILKAAFSGELIAQTIGDEPASILLERIAAERAGTKTAAPLRSRKKKPA